MEILEMFKSKYCWLVFLTSMALAYWIVTSSLTFGFTDTLVMINVVIFVALFALSLTCNIRLLKTKIKESKSRAYTSGIVSTVLYILGITAIESCLVSGVCGISLGLSLLSLILPTVALDFFIRWGFWILVIVNVFLFVSLFYMKCFERKKKSLLVFKL